MVSGLAKRLKSSRANAGYSRKQAADVIGITESTIGLYESGSRQPSLTALMKLASAYKVTTDYLLGCEPREKYSVSLAGLTDQQIRSINLTIQCFRNPTD
ncbi:MAG: helix-turn-helix transcriptional regulator [Pseudobutyrivibrio ruminis]|nr:helix-turn-helix transcriptional regulator [Pseudobutyrivibrio ruminis]